MVLSVIVGLRNKVGLVFPTYVCIQNHTPGTSTMYVIVFTHSATQNFLLLEEDHTHDLLFRFRG